MRHLQALLESISMEAAVLDGAAKQEMEYTFFARVGDWAQFGQAQRSEQQEQWEFFCQPGDGREGTVRIRSINNQQFVLCTKLKTPGEIGKAEAEIEVTGDMFKHFRALAPKGTYRTRYVFPIANSNNVWEIDVFKNAKGETVPWVKIDLEVGNANDPIPPLPINVEEKIVSQPSARSEDEKQIITDLFDNQYALGGSNRDTWLQTAATMISSDPVSNTTEEEQAAINGSEPAPVDMGSTDAVTPADVDAAAADQAASTNAGEPSGDGSDELPTPVVPDAPAATDATATPEVPAVAETPVEGVTDATDPVATPEAPETPAPDTSAAPDTPQLPAADETTTETESTVSDPTVSEPATPTVPADPEAPPSDLNNPNNPDNPDNPEAPISEAEVPPLPEEEDELDENGLPKVPVV